MFKAITITALSAGVLGTGATTLTPQTLEISAGALIVEVGSEGLNFDVNAKPDFGFTLTTKGDRQFTVRL